jgi:type I restriction enzyme S subunit
MRLGKMLDAARQHTGAALPYLRNINVRWGEFDLSNLLTMTFLPRETDEFRLVPGDLLVCEGGEPGRSAVWAETVSSIKFQKAIHRIRLSAGIEPKWLMYDLRRAALDGSLDAYFTGSTIKHLTGVSLARYVLRVPPMPEQKRIVSKVEELLGRVNAARQRLAKAPALLKRFRQSVLAAACSGQLTADWRDTHTTADSAQTILERIAADRLSFGKHSGKCRNGEVTASAEQLSEVPDLWTWGTLEQIGQEGRPIIYGIIKPGPHDPDGVPYVRVTEMKDGFVDVPNLRRANKERAAKFARATLVPGDLLVSKDGTIGRVAVVPPELAGGNITQHLVRAPVHPLMNRNYVVAAIRAPLTQKWLTEEKLGVALQGVNVEDFRRLPIPIPPIAEQHEIVRRVEALFALADRIEARVRAATARVERITQAILAKAFRGELVPTEAELARQEGRDYEPASVLLARIRTAREAQTDRPAPRRGRGGNSMARHSTGR